MLGHLLQKNDIKAVVSDLATFRKNRTTLATFSDLATFCEIEHWPPFYY